MTRHVNAEWLKTGREGETIKGGYIIFRRGKKTGRVGVGSTLPFEYDSYEAAEKEVARLTGLFPEEKFHIFADLMIHQF